MFVSNNLKHYKKMLMNLWLLDSLHSFTLKMCILCGQSSNSKINAIITKLSSFLNFQMFVFRLIWNLRKVWRCILVDSACTLTFTAQEVMFITGSCVFPSLATENNGGFKYSRQLLIDWCYSWDQKHCRRDRKGAGVMGPALMSGWLSQSGQSLF